MRNVRIHFFSRTLFNYSEFWPMNGPDKTPSVLLQPQTHGREMQQLHNITVNAGPTSCNCPAFQRNCAPPNSFKISLPSFSVLFTNLSSPKRNNISKIPNGITNNFPNAASPNFRQTPPKASQLHPANSNRNIHTTQLLSRGSSKTNKRLRQLRLPPIQRTTHLYRRLHFLLPPKLYLRLGFRRRPILQSRCLPPRIHRSHHRHSR